MRGWVRTFNVSDVFHDESLTFEQRRDAIANRLAAHRWATVNRCITDLADDLGDTANEDEFDCVWDAIYDEADRDRTWVRTV